MTNEYTRLEYDCSSGIEKIIYLTEEEISKLKNKIEENKKIEAELLEKENQIAIARKSAIEKLKSFGLTELEIESLAVV